MERSLTGGPRKKQVTATNQKHWVRHLSVSHGHFVPASQSPHTPTHHTPAASMQSNILLQSSLKYPNLISLYWFCKVRRPTLKLTNYDTSWHENLRVACIISTAWNWVLHGILLTHIKCAIGTSWQLPGTCFLAQKSEDIVLTYRQILRKPCQISLGETDRQNKYKWTAKLYFLFDKVLLSTFTSPEHR